MNLKISSLSIYPLKSAKGINRTSMQLGRLGPDLDRRWMLVDQRGDFITQRKHPRLSQISTELVGEELSLSAAGFEPMVVSSATTRLHKSKVWGSVVYGYDCGDEVANYLGEFLGLTCRLIFMPESHERKVDPNYAHNNELVSFADGFPLLITTQASLDDFNQKLGYSIGMERFRPNVVIAGNDAYAEDNWQRIVINGITFSLAKPCSRCIMPSVNPTTSKKEMQVNQTLMKYRRRDRNTYFGQNAIYDQFGVINIGDDVKIL